MPGVDDYAQQLKQLHPRGMLWESLLRVGSIYSKLLTGIAHCFARIDDRAAALIDESDPRSTTEMLPDWENAAAIPGDCGLIGETIAERQQNLTAKITQQAGDSKQDLIDIAERHGFAPATITEYTSHSVDSDVDAPIYGADWRFAIKLTAPNKPVITFTVDSAVDESLGSELSGTQLECAIKKMAPAHCVVIFEYQ